MDFNFNEKQQELVSYIEKWVKDVFAPIAEEFGEQDALCLDMVYALGESGLMKTMIPPEFGGTNDDNGTHATELCIIRETLARLCPLAESTYSVTGLGSYPVILAGSEAQKNKYLSGVATGKTVFAFALTEPNAGSDALRLSTQARLEGDEWVLNGRKIFISNAGYADAYTVFAKTDDAPGSRGISAFLVDADTPGFEVVRKLSMIAPHPIGEISFSNCRIPKENLLGERGRGFKYAMQTLDVFRSSVAAQLIGFAQAALDKAAAYAKTRQAFGGPLTQFQSIQHKLADMYMEVESARNLVYYAAWRKDLGNRVTKEAAIAKLYASQVAQRVAYEGQQIFGGYGMIKGNPIELLYREVRPPAIYEGTTEIQHMIIGRGMLSGDFIDEEATKVFW
ncbi:acyl-CoA dehydrogenase family protein [Alicyclobacillus dauci]|uniref:Acyl-CoA dehydrogenase family protein n=1 Tax=Alicyclobacillus dauci TaxID=1475485 RepID=A0ABY6YZZ1_9BACL|nr:acyl-CoA dehydrogenase family protein [Alicyclobacillus dauci]WAH36207.1 acyl-CoA dehydrogenase family protein [Alicyclobacillus dauci]